MGILFTIPDRMQHEQLDKKLPDWFWYNWPKTRYGGTFLFLHNQFTGKYDNAVWHGYRPFPLFFIEDRYKMVKGVCDQDYKLIDEALDAGFDINAPIIVELRRGLNAYALAAELDRLEVLHYLELKGAKPSQDNSKEISSCSGMSIPSGKFNTTPLMAAVNAWNVRVVEYLIERMADPDYLDTQGFTAKEKADIKNLSVISKMIEFHQNQAKDERLKKKYEEKLNAERKYLQYDKIKLIDPNNKKIIQTMPSSYLTYADYPFFDIENTPYILRLFDVEYQVMS